ncbi:MAG: DUF542 domain-containing protein [Saprospiraceae bacterium]|jgi:regulator of cell morphogenesis and NO signaling|nr:DUF542 domain-containing protein [Saprospiraceae bacterium]
MNNLLETSLAEQVGKHPTAAAVFEKYQLGFCCNDKYKLINACQAHGLDATAVTMELEDAFSKREAPQIPYLKYKPLDELADYIVERHHNYVREMIPRLLAITKRMAERHGEGNPDLVKIAGLWEMVAEKMTLYMFKEERDLFPYIKRLVQAKRTRDPWLFPRYPFVSAAIQSMENEHDEVGGLMQEIRDLSNNYTPPPGACTAHRLCFHELKEFEEDFQRHVHLENHLLFPGAKELEPAALTGFVMEKVAGGAQ